MEAVGGLTTSVAAISIIHISDLVVQLYILTVLVPSYLAFPPWNEAQPKTRAVYRITHHECPSGSTSALTTGARAAGDRDGPAFKPLSRRYVSRQLPTPGWAIPGKGPVPMAESGLVGY
jgi:hypothetical protein